MAKQYKGSLTLEWFNKQKAIVSLNENSIKSDSDIPAPRINWINKDEALFYELNQEEGKGNAPYWVNRDDIRVKEARPLVFQKAFKAVEKDKEGTLPGTEKEFVIEKITNEENALEIENILIKGDNLLALNTLKKHFDKLPDNEKVKCVYIDPPYNIDVANEDYDDNLQHSEWLTLMRDRLQLLYALLSESGVMFVQISDGEEAYLKILLDEIFGRDNFINKITIRTKSPSGFQTVNLGVFETAEYIFLYGKDKKAFTYYPQFTECQYDENYNQYITNINEHHSKWEIIAIKEYLASIEGFSTSKDFVKSTSKELLISKVSKFAIDNCNSVFRLTAISDSGAGKETVDLKYESKKKTDTVLVQKRENYPDRYILNGQEVAFYAKKVKEIDGKLVPTIPLTNIWSDIAYEGIAGEGNVTFKKSKKPEKLIRRILNMSTNVGDIVLDSFLGSGTTAAVAHKMDRKWLGVELGNHADELILPRIESIIKGSDLTGVSKDLKWQGGGSFKYYHLGESIITVDKETGKGEFNWSLGKQFIQESLLVSYDFVVQKDIDVFPAQIFKDNNSPTVGKLLGKNNKSIYGLSFLVAPGEKELTISNEEIKSIYNVIRKQEDFNALVIYTNKGIDIAQDAMPNDMDIVKVPHAIFAELER
jgi:adenine-specific DNA-methyltransferase